MKDKTLKEGKKVSLPISQVKEVIRIVLSELAHMNPITAIMLVLKYRNRK